MMVSVCVLQVIVWGPCSFEDSGDSGPPPEIKPCSSVLDVGDSATAVAFCPALCSDRFLFLDYFISKLHLYWPIGIISVFPQVNPAENFELILFRCYFFFACGKPHIADKDTFTSQAFPVFYSPPSWKVWLSFVVHKTFLELHIKAVLQRSPFLTKVDGDFFKNRKLKNGFIQLQLLWSNSPEAPRSQIDFEKMGWGDELMTNGSLQPNETKYMNYLCGH